MLNEQYRMHPEISHFPRHIFYGGTLLDGPNVTQPNYGSPLIPIISSKVPSLKVGSMVRYICLFFFNDKLKSCLVVIP